MALFVLVPGAWHGAWCWANMAETLAKSGHTCLTPDLPLVPPGENPLPIWAKTLVALLHAAPAPVILLGHSRAGLVINEAAVLAPGRVRALVYLAAFLLPPGESLQNAMARPEAGEAPSYLRPARGRCVAVAPDAIIPYFYPLAPRALAEHAASRLHPEPLGTFSAPATVAAHQLASIPRIYIECLDDKVIPLALQRAMQAAMPCTQVMTLPSDHSPFLCMPERLAAALEAVTDDLRQQT